MSDPLTPATCDLRGMPFMPLDVVRLLDSDLFALSTGDEFKAAIALWCKSWNQVPAASLPCDDRILARLAALSLREWSAVKATALRGWVLCDDGRLYHPVVASKATEAWAARERQRERANKRWSKTSSDAPADPPHGAAADAPAHAAADATAYPAAMQGTGTGTGNTSEGRPSEGCAVERASASDDLDWPESPHPSRPYLDKLEEALREAGGSALSAASPSLISLAPILALAKGGAGPRCELQADVLPAIRAAARKARPGSIASWGWFVQPCQDARDRRLAGAGEAKVVDLSRARSSDITTRIADEHAEASRRATEILERRRGHTS